MQTKKNGKGKNEKVENKVWIRKQEAGEYLPVGSIVKIDGLEQKVVIIGKLQYNGRNTEKLYDYAGVDYPVGFLNPKEIWMFDMYKITEVVHRGYVDSEEQALNKKISEFWKQHPEKR